MTVSSVWRLLFVLTAALVGVQASPGTAFADPAGPTDYLSEILSVEPATPTIDVSVIGGDSFVQLVASAGTDVVVYGYNREEYLWFQPDGTVLENRNSPTTYTNEDRFAGGDIPPTATAGAEPDWQPVASNGRYAWHDHRAHWMQPIRPAGKGAGDRIVEDVIALRVDGEDVAVEVISTWQPAASRLPTVIGVVVAAGLAAVGAWRYRRDRRWVVVAVPLAAVAVVAGVWQYTSLPSETGPRVLWWLFPVVALIAALLALVADVARRTFLARAAVMISGAQLALWGLIKRDGLSAALIPTGAPGWFDRFATSSALIGGVGLALVALVALFTVPGRSGPTPT